MLDTFSDTPMPPRLVCEPIQRIAAPPETSHGTARGGCDGWWLVVCVQFKPRRRLSPSRPSRGASGLHSDDNKRLINPKGPALTPHITRLGKVLALSRCTAKGERRPMFVYVVWNRASATQMLRRLGVPTSKRLATAACYLSKPPLREPRTMPASASPPRSAGSPDQSRTRRRQRRVRCMHYNVRGRG